MAKVNEGQVLVMLAMLAEQSGEVVSETRLDYVGQRLIQLGTPTEVCAALEALIESSRRFPTIADVREAMGVADPTARDAALMLADRVLAGISRYGELQPGNVKGARAIEAALGPAAWELVQRQGGWNAVVDRAGQAGTFKAQIRDAAESYLKCGVISRDDVTGEKLPSHFEALTAAEKKSKMLAAPAYVLPDPNTEEPPF